MRQAAPRARARSTTYVIIKEFLFDFNAAHVLYLRICVNALVGSFEFEFGSRGHSGIYIGLVGRYRVD